MKINKNLKDLIDEDIICWEVQTNHLTENFLYDYFDDEDPDYWWVSNDIGGVFNYGDYWFNFSDVLTCYKIGITEEQLTNWYDFCLENQSVNISLARYILSPEERKETGSIAKWYESGVGRLI